MIRVSVMANNSLLADGIAATLAKEIDLDVVRVTRRELSKMDQHSVVIVIDEGEREHESIQVADLLRGRDNVILIMLSLESRTVYIYESYQLVNPDAEQVIHIIREFSRMNPKKNSDVHPLTRTSAGSLNNEMTALFNSFFLHFLRRKNLNNVTPLMGFGHPSGFDT